MKNSDATICNLINARIISFENGNIQSIILVKKKSQLYSITISNSHKFIILKYKK